MKKAKGAGSEISLYYSQTVSVSEEEKLFLDVLAMHEGMKPATVARRLLYMGIASYLKDRQLRLPRPEPLLHEELAKLLESDQMLRTIRDIIQRHQRQPSRAERKARRAS